MMIEIATAKKRIRKSLNGLRLQELSLDLARITLILHAWKANTSSPFHSRIFLDDRELKLLHRGNGKHYYTSRLKVICRCFV